MLRDIKSMNQNIFLTVDTTCPLAKCERPPTPKTPGFDLPPTIIEDEVRVENESKRSNRHHRHSRKSRRKHRKHRLDQSDIPEWIKVSQSKSMLNKKNSRAVVLWLFSEGNLELIY